VGRRREQNKMVTATRTIKPLDFNFVVIEFAAHWRTSRLPNLLARQRAVSE